MISLWPPYNRLQRLPEDEDAYCMNTAWLLKTGLIGNIIAALCCFTPILAVLLGAVGLGWFVGYLDDVLVPVIVIFLGLVGYTVWRNAKKAR
jgi:mercuric ion transport protein